MAPPFLNSKRTRSPGLTSPKAAGSGLPKPMVIGGHFSAATGPWEMVMPSASTPSTLPSPTKTAGCESAGAGSVMRPVAERSLASESMRNWPLTTTCSPSRRPWATSKSSPISRPRLTSRLSNAPPSLRTSTTARWPVRMTASDGTSRRDALGPAICKRSNMPGTSRALVLSTSKRACSVRLAALICGKISVSSPLKLCAASACSAAFTRWLRVKRAACASGISATAHTRSRPEMRNSVVPADTATPSRTPSSLTTPDTGATSV